MRIRQFISYIAMSASFLAPAPALAEPAAGADSAPQSPSPSVTARKPNVLVWMLDDVGFAQFSCFGGLIDTPNIDRVARMGLRYSNYHTAPICSASRAAFLTGRNPHTVHVGGHSGAPRPFPGHDALLPAAAGTIAENLRQAGYATFALGKWDHLPAEEQSASGPFNRWPLGQGFDRFYGFLAAETDNWKPVLVRDNGRFDTPARADYHLSSDLADSAIEMIETRRTTNPRPFFMYWATGVAHAPHHAPAEWISRYKGRFDIGWDEARKRILKRQISQGLIPASTQLAPRPEGLPAWNSLTPAQRRLYARQMEAFAAALSHADAQFGRILDRLETSGELDNTIVIVTSDNGASAEGGLAGTYSELTFMNGRPNSMTENMKFHDQWGGPDTYPHYGFGWAVAGNTPFRYYKMTAHEGGIHVPLVVAWPSAIRATGEIRNDFAYVSDLAPTILGATGVPLAERVNNVPQIPMDGQNLTASFTKASAPGAHRSQYFEMYGNKGLWADGWTIVTSHQTKPWDLTLATPPEEAWELYDVRRDPGQVHDLAKKFPDRVSAMSAEFEVQAERYHVNPVGNMSEMRKNSAERARAEFKRRRGVWEYLSPVSRIIQVSAPPILNADYRMTADINLATGGETGPIFAMGGSLGGVGLYLHSGRPTFMLRSLDGEAVRVESPSPLPAGNSRLELEFSRDGAKPLEPTGLKVAIRANGKLLASREMSFPLPALFSIAETFDIGRDDGRALTADYATSSVFPGELRNIRFDFNAAQSSP